MAQSPSKRPKLDSSNGIQSDNHPMIQSGAHSAQHAPEHARGAISPDPTTFSEATLEGLRGKLDAFAKERV